MPNGNLKYSGEYGQAIYSIKVIGSKSTIRVQVELVKKPENEWEIIKYYY